MDDDTAPAGGSTERTEPHLHGISAAVLPRRRPAFASAIPPDVTRVKAVISRSKSVARVARLTFVQLLLPPRSATARIFRGAADRRSHLTIRHPPSPPPSRAAGRPSFDAACAPRSRAWTAQGPSLSVIAVPLHAPQVPGPGLFQWKWHPGTPSGPVALATLPRMDSRRQA
jgi:hypothetical protein